MSSGFGIRQRLTAGRALDNVKGFEAPDNSFAARRRGPRPIEVTSRPPIVCSLLVVRIDGLTNCLRKGPGVAVRSNHAWRRRLASYRLLLAGLLMLSVLSARGDKLTSPEIATKLGMSVQQVQSLCARFDLTKEDLLGLPGISLQLMLWDLEHPGIDKHAEEEKFRALRMMDEHGRVPPDGLARALEHRRRRQGDEDFEPGKTDPSPITPDFGTPEPLSAGLQTSGWTWLGPGNIGVRVRSILAHPTATNILWCGGVDGGIWKSTNSGAAWFPLNDFMANLAVACMVMDPSNA